MSPRNNKVRETKRAMAMTMTHEYHIQDSARRQRPMMGSGTVGGEALKTRTRRDGRVLRVTGVGLTLRTR